MMTMDQRIKNNRIGNGEFEEAALKNRSTKDCPGMLMRANLVRNAVGWLYKVRRRVQLVRNAAGRPHKDGKFFRTGRIVLHLGCVLNFRKSKKVEENRCSSAALQPSAPM